MKLIYQFFLDINSSTVDCNRKKTVRELIIIKEDLRQATLSRNLLKNLVVNLMTRGI